jgi:23S rRNA (adenine2503-C2)-methyltransferase
LNQPTHKTDLLELTFNELDALVAALGEKPFRAGQIRKWLYKYGQKDIEGMTDLSRALRTRLAEKTTIGRMTCLEVTFSEDGTRKFLWELSDGNRIESVIIPERDHFTLCLSSQVGCAMGCRFCRTSELGWRRNLSQGEIVGQVLGVRDHLRDSENLTNLVFMGMGEPLANRVNVIRALHILTEPGLLAFSRKHLSVSTVGLAPEIPRLAEVAHIGLTVSLNAADDPTRDALMPINRKYPLAELHKTLAAYPLPKGRRITIAYVLLAGVNDSTDHAQKLVRFLHGLRVKINLIPFNPFPGSLFEAPADETVAAFRQVLQEKHYTVIVRKSKGRDVSAACGQLAAGYEKRKTG